MILSDAFIQGCALQYRLWALRAQYTFEQFLRMKLAEKEAAQ